VAIAVGLFALQALPPKPAWVMLTYVDSAHGVAQPPQRRRTTVHGYDDRAAIRAGAVDRVRPKMITVCA
jgi:copper/silver efflux system protein